jgi:hypothetical protein
MGTAFPILRWGLGTKRSTLLHDYYSFNLLMMTYALIYGLNPTRFDPASLIGLVKDNIAFSVDGDSTTWQNWRYSPQPCSDAKYEALPLPH